MGNDEDNINIILLFLYFVNDSLAFCAMLWYNNKYEKPKKEFFLNLMKVYAKKICIHTCIYYTIATFVLLLIYAFLSRDLSQGLQVKAQICLLPFALLFATANVLFKHAPISAAWRVALHYALTLSGIMLCLYLPNKDPQASGSQGLILYIALTAIYAIVMGVILGLGARIKHVQRDSARYTSLYKNKDDKKAEQDKNGKGGKKKKPDRKNDEYQNVFKK